MENYTGLAEIYDAMMDDFDYPKWVDYYARLIARGGITRGRLCDCACGTGSMTLELAKRGFDATGVDISGEMLERASIKARAAGKKIMFVKQDMCALTLTRAADVITCACDGVNYLTTEARLAAFFERVYQNLKPSGVFAFDFSSRAKLEGKLGNAFFAEERDEAAYIWQNTFDAEKHIVDMDITFFVREPSGLYRRFNEKHRQRAHAPEEIAKLLEHAGFCDIGIFGDMTFEKPTDADMRIHMTARRDWKQA